MRMIGRRRRDEPLQEYLGARRWNSCGVQSIPHRLEAHGKEPGMTPALPKVFRG